MISLEARKWFGLTVWVVTAVDAGVEWHGGKRLSASEVIGGWLCQAPSTPFLMHRYSIDFRLHMPLCSWIPDLVRNITVLNAQ